MSDLAALAFALIIICVVIYAVVTIYNRRFVGAAQVARTPWQLEEHGSEKTWILLACRPGTSEQRVLNSILWDDPNFDERVEEARINGETRLHTLNRTLPK